MHRLHGSMASTQRDAGLHLSQANNNFDRLARCNVSFRGNVYFRERQHKDFPKQISSCLPFSFLSYPNNKWIRLSGGNGKRKKHTWNGLTNCSNIWLCIVWLPATQNAIYCIWAWAVESIYSMVDSYLESFLSEPAITRYGNATPKLFKISMNLPNFE